jgi:hypothetical protein
MHTFVRSMSWLGRTRSPGAISSCKLPTALNATIALMPKLLKAAMLALEGTVEGVIWWLTPWRAIKAISSPDGSAKMEMGEDGLPHGCIGHSSAFEGMIQASSSQALPAHRVDLDAPDEREVVELVQAWNHDRWRGMSGQMLATTAVNMPSRRNEFSPLPPITPTAV